MSVLPDTRKAAAADRDDADDDDDELRCTLM